MMMLITGGAGFIGSAVIRYLIRHTEHSVINVDALTYAGNPASLAVVEASERYAFEKANINDAARMSEVFTRYQPDAVMHLAAESNVDRSIDAPAIFIQTNIVGTYILLETVRHYWEGLQRVAPEKAASFRFHHVSTDEVYGDLAEQDTRFSEASSYAPSSPYSASKASSDHLVRAWHRTFKLPVIVTNCSNNYGPYHLPDKLIPLVIINALAGKPLPVYGNGQQVRDWLYVEDHARALVKVITAGKVGETYTIGGNNEKTNLEVIETLCDLLQEVIPAAQPYHDLIMFVKDRPGHDQRYAIDARKITRKLGWQPEESFETGLRKTLHWYLDNQTWWQNRP